jgi:hypothetical protein
MELLLNLAWLLLALPAYALWRSARTARRRYGFTSLQCLFALGCALVLLFPVISATDDLHAMRAEMDESPASKRSARPGSNDRNSISSTRLQSPPAILGSLNVFVFRAEREPVVPIPSAFVPAARSSAAAGRAPPAFRIV